jgi:hypothetical protein
MPNLTPYLGGDTTKYVPLRLSGLTAMLKCPLERCFYATADYTSNSNKSRRLKPSCLSRPPPTAHIEPLHQDLFRLAWGLHRQRAPRRRHAEARLVWLCGRRRRRGPRTKLSRHPPHGEGKRRHAPHLDDSWRVLLAGRRELGQDGDVWEEVSCCEEDHDVDEACVR